MLTDFARGVRHGLDGLRLLAGRPRLWGLVIWPFAISLASLVGIAVAVVALRGHFLPAGGAWRPVLSIATAIAVPIVCYFLFLPVALLVAAPFNDAISARVEEIVTGRAPAGDAPTTAAGVVRSLVHQARTFARWLLLAVAVLAASLALPGIGSLVGLLAGGYLAARFAGWDAIDTPLARWGWSYDERLAFLRRRRALCLGTGTVVAVALALPVVNALAMPLAAAAGTVLAVKDAERSDKVDGTR